MQFNSETNGLDLYSDARYLCGIDETSDTTSYPIKAFTRNANLAVDRENALILKADGGWKYDDANQTGELLDVTNNITSGTQKIALGVTWLKIAKVRIKDSAGNWITLNPISRKKLTDGQLTAPAGTPTGYYILGNYLYFDKAPNYSSAGGLEVQYQRGGAYFTYTDTTKVPGWAVQFHRLVSLHAALNYCQINSLNARVVMLQGMIGSPPDLENGQAGSGMEKELMDFYSQRNSDAQPNISFKREDYGETALGNGPGSSNPYGWN